MVVKDTTGRLRYEPRCNYCSKVLIGTWFEDLQRYVQNKHNHVSKYSIDYAAKDPSFVDPDDIWDNKIQAEGYGPRILIDHERNKYHGNFSTTYDLSYNHIPHIVKTSGRQKKYSNIIHSYVPQQDLAINYGNVTELNGLRAIMKNKWKSEKIDPPPIMASEMQASYTAHDKSAYVYQRRAPDKNKSAKVVPANLDLANLHLRGRRVSLPPDSLVKEQKKYICPMHIKSLE